MRRLQEPEQRESRANEHTINYRVCMNEIIGKPIDRVSGRLKVTGGACRLAVF